MIMELEALKKSVCNAIPTLEQGILEDVVKNLVSAEVESDSDLQFIQEDDLNKVLKPIQVRKLLQAWRNTSPSKSKTLL